MPSVNIPHVGVVNFPDSMSSSEIQDKAAHFHGIGKLSAATPSVDVTRSAGFAERNQQHAPEMKQFIGKTESLPDGRRHASLMDAHNTLRQVQSVPVKNLPTSTVIPRSEFQKLLHEDITESTKRAGTFSEYQNAARPQPSASPMQPTGRPPMNGERSNGNRNSQPRQ
jgi:hypothetical protein